MVGFALLFINTLLKHQKRFGQHLQIKYN